MICHFSEILLADNIKLFYTVSVWQLISYFYLWNLKLGLSAMHHVLYGASCIWMIEGIRSDGVPVCCSIVMHYRDPLIIFFLSIMCHLSSGTLNHAPDTTAKHLEHPPP